MTLQSWIQSKSKLYIKKKKQLKRKLFFFKAKVFLVFILPAFILLLAAKIAKTFLQIKLRDAAASVPIKKPVTQTSFKPQIVKPEPVGSASSEHTSTSSTPL